MTYSSSSFSWIFTEWVFVNHASFISACHQRQALLTLHCFLSASLVALFSCLSPRFKILSKHNLIHILININPNLSQTLQVQIRPRSSMFFFHVCSQVTLKIVSLANENHSKSSIFIFDSTLRASSPICSVSDPLYHCYILIISQMGNIRIITFFFRPSSTDFLLPLQIMT